MKNTIFMSAFVVAMVFALSGVAGAQARYKQIHAEAEKCEKKFPGENDEAARDKCIEAAYEIPHPIDAALEKCLAGTHGTMPRAECYSTAAQAWETEAKINYPKVLKVIPPELLEPFKANQLAWEKYRISLEEFNAEKNAGQRGTMHIGERIRENIDIWKRRAVFLNGLLDQYER
jgi:hypothetical protein